MQSTAKVDVFSPVHLRAHWLVSEPVADIQVFLHRDLEFPASAGFELRTLSLLSGYSYHFIHTPALQVTFD
jgi:hypothetical protein